MKRAATMTRAASAFALVVVLILANPPNAHALLFGGGKRDGLFGLAMVALAPLIVVVQIGLGTALAHRFASVAALREPWLLWLSGSALLSLIGVAIAAASLVSPWVCGSLLILGVAYAVASGACTDVLKRLIAWTRLEDVASSKPAFAAVRLGIVAALVLIGLRAATGELNDTDVVIIQHEYGIFGGEDGDEVLDVIEALTVPVIVVLHTVPLEPSAHQRSVLEAVVGATDIAVTMTHAARRRLAAGYKVDMTKVSVIPHGAHVAPRPAIADIGTDRVIPRGAARARHGARAAHPVAGRGAPSATSPARRHSTAPANISAKKTGTAATALNAEAELRKPRQSATIVAAAPTVIT